MRYCPYFCEENIWHLCRDDVVKDGERVIPLEDRRAVFISNDRRAVPMDHQKAGEGNVVVWDYHVVMFAFTRAGWQVWDLDHARGAPRDLTEWMHDTFLVDLPLEAYRELTGLDIEWPRFRIVDAEEYLAVFSSDRRHMLDPRGRPTRPFPPWDAIVTGENTLLRFVEMRAAWVGACYSYDDVRLQFCMK